jgi:hypothetical protein
MSPAMACTAAAHAIASAASYVMYTSTASNDDGFPTSRSWSAAVRVSNVMPRRRQRHLGLPSAECVETTCTRAGTESVPRLPRERTSSAEYPHWMAKLRLPKKVSSIFLGLVVVPHRASLPPPAHSTHSTPHTSVQFPSRFRFRFVYGRRLSRLVHHSLRTRHRAPFGPRSGYWNSGHGTSTLALTTKPTSLTSGCADRGSAARQSMLDNGALPIGTAITRLATGDRHRHRTASQCSERRMSVGSSLHAKPYLAIPPKKDDNSPAQSQRRLQSSLVTMSTYSNLPPN